MQEISAFESLQTSISLPEKTYRRLSAALRVLARNGVHVSEQEIYRRLIKPYLLHWKGTGRKTSGLTRYNCASKVYLIRPLYVSQVLYAAVRQRASHSGESVSRIVDFSVRCYLPRLMELLLAGSQSPNSAYWEKRRAERHCPHGDFFINYVCRTEKNQGGNLIYVQETQIIPKSSLSPWQILTYLRIAA